MTYKAKLSAFSGAFSQHQQDIRDLLQGQSSLQLIDIQVNQAKILEHINTLTQKESLTIEFVKARGGPNAVLSVGILGFALSM